MATMDSAPGAATPRQQDPEHAQLGLRSLVHKLEDSQTLREALPLLERALAILPPHFSNEEGAGGLFDRILSAKPNHQRAVEGLRSEHEQFVQSLESLQARAQAMIEGPVAELLEEARALSAHLEAHEKTENDLWCDALYTDLGGGD